MKKIKLKLLFIIISIFLITNCENDNIENNDNDIEIPRGLLFEVKKEITIPEYTYEDEHNYTYKIKSSKNSLNLDTTNTNPLIKWDTVDSPMTIVTISEDSLKVNNNKIININSIIWMWHNGMLKGKNGQIYIYDGSDVEDGIIKNEITEDLLKINKTYYLYIWAFDYYGKKVKYSSKLKKLFIIR